MSNKRKALSPNFKMALLTQAKGRCPKCGALIMGKKNNSHIVLFEVAHIYPLNPTPQQALTLKNEEKLSEEIDSFENMIPLCLNCHKMFDTELTVEEYRELISIKKYLTAIEDLTQNWNGQSLHTDILKVTEILSELDSSDDLALLSYTALNIDHKIDDSLGNMNKRKIEHLITDFYILIRDSFNSIEKESKHSVMLIFAQVKAYFCTLQAKNLTQKQIFIEMCNWFSNKTQLNDNTKAEILVSFFIQNCEVFESATSQ